MGPLRSSVMVLIRPVSLIWCHCDGRIWAAAKAPRVMAAIGRGRKWRAEDQPKPVLDVVGEVDPS